MQLKNYQNIAVDKLLKISKKLLEKDGQRVLIFKAPTGSGKTIMIADFLKNLTSELVKSNYSFIWISGYNLHKQSREKIENYLNPSNYTFSYIEDVQNNELKENEIVFVNWHSLTKQDRKTGEYTNIYMRDNETGRNLKTYIYNTKEKGGEVILIVDESHYHYWSQKSQQLIQEVIGPKLTIEVSATPKLEPTGEELEFEEAGRVTVRFSDVIAEGMIKTEVVINKEIGNYTDFNQAADEVILSAVIDKQNELVSSYETIGVKINPLILVQLPSESTKTSALDRTKLEFVENYFKDKHNITVENGLLGIWLSDRKTNIKNISSPTDPVKVLIFKQAIALGWDCPRAQMLVMFRDIRSTTFEIQTVGRILRMPEAKHYKVDELNRAFVYTNLDRIRISSDLDSRGFFKINPSKIKPGMSQVNLQSVYLSRIDYGDLTLSFRALFIEEANKYFGVKGNDFPHDAKAKADQKLDLKPNELTEPIISDAVISGIDDVESIVGKIVHFAVPEDDLKYKFEIFAKLNSLPYAPVRSHTKIQQALYDWFDSFLGYKDVSRLEIQRIVVCSENNQKIFKEIIETAKEQFRKHKIKEKQSKRVRREFIWSVPSIDYFNELFEKVNYKNFVMEPCYLRTERKEPEKAFEEALSKSKKVDWWYKNGESKEIYFAIPYPDPEDGLLRSFYPDFIVRFKDGSIGIYDTKAGFTIESVETDAKSNALQDYIQQNIKDGQNLKGGIIAHKRTGLFEFTGSEYNSDTNSEYWKRLDL